MGKKIAVGCLAVFVLVVLAGGGFAYFKFVRPAQQAFAAAKQVAEFQQLDRDVNLKGIYDAPADGVLASTQVDRYLAVHQMLGLSLKGKLNELDERYEALSADDAKPGFGAMVRAWSDLANLLVEAKKAQVAALNANDFSVSEYDWVRGQVLRAAGYTVFQVDPATLGSDQGTVTTEDAPVPQENVELVEPHVEELQTPLALAAFGL